MRVEGKWFAKKACRLCPPLNLVEDMLAFLLVLDCTQKPVSIPPLRRIIGFASLVREDSHYRAGFYGKGTNDVPTNSKLSFLFAERSAAFSFQPFLCGWLGNERVPFSEASDIIFAGSVRQNVFQPSGQVIEALEVNPRIPDFSPLQVNAFLFVESILGFLKIFWKIGFVFDF
ncbi:MAG: hypothetical protein HY394_02545 [Candidatus Diapherotrites archaeon]|nr:hypothetical protein [Candidatus Diapherotrites archaeon]